MPQLAWRLIAALGAALVALIAAAHAQDKPAQAQPAQGVSRADVFIAAFGPAPNDKALRASELEMREQVRLAFYGIDATRVQVEQGKLSEAEGALIIDGFQRTLRNFIHDNAQEPLIVATAGQAADIPRIRAPLGALLSVARQDALMGREDVALEAQAQMVSILTSFSQKFAETCDQQTFPAELAFALERQNQLLGTGVSTIHCGRRKYSADIMSEGVQYHFETCTLLGEGEWELTISGLVRGSGSATIQPDGHGEWEGSTTFRGHHDDWVAGLVMVKEEVPAAPPRATAPNDAGPLARPNGRPKAPLSASNEQPPEKITIHKLRMEPIDMVGEGRGYIGTGPWAEAEMRRGLDQACEPKG